MASLTQGRTWREISKKGRKTGVCQGVVFWVEKDDLRGAIATATGGSGTPRRNPRGPTLVIWGGGF